MEERIHRLVVKETGKQGVWELYCPQCEFQGVYKRLPGNGEYVIRILQRGNQRVIHTSAGLSSLGQQESALMEETALQPGEYISLDNWLTPHLREQIDEILAPLELD